MSRAGAVFKNTVNRKKNLFINGDMAFAQRGASLQTLTLAGSGLYYLDRWKSAGFAITTPQISQSSLPAGFPGNPETTRALRMVGTANAANTQVYAEQRVESIRHKQMNEDVVSLGFWVWVSNFTNIRVQLSTANAKDDFSAVTPFLDVDIPVDVDSAWQFIKVENEAVPNQNGMVMSYYADQVANPAGAFDSYFTEAMMNDGPTLEPFTTMGDTFDEELILCQRYFEKSYDVDTPPATTFAPGRRAWGVNTYGVSDNSTWNGETFSVVKRVNPVMTMYSYNFGTVGFFSDSGGTNRAGVFGVGNSGFEIKHQDGSSSIGFFYHFTAEAEL